MSWIDDGTYPGTIKDAYVDTGGKYGAKACFVVELDGLRAVTAKHALDGEHEVKTPPVFEEVGLEYPAGLRDMTKCIGRKVDVNVKNNGQYVNAYISTGPVAKKATPAEVESIIARLSVSTDDPIPF